MGMMEERKDSACSAIQHCERMYAETQNPYYVVMALGAARWGDFAPPEWALDVLLTAVNVATFQHNVTGARISIDAALGLTLSRGKTPREREAQKHDAEARAFDLVRTIHACFDVSIPAACELAYYAIDFDFARGLAEDFGEPGEKLTTYGERGVANAARNEHAPIARAKVQAREWFNITYGDRLGYSLDQFIDRYYREGTRRAGRFPDLHGEGEFFEGTFLLLQPELCTRKITLADCDGYQPRAVSDVSKLPKRADFARFEAKLNARIATVSKPAISAQ